MHLDLSNDLIIFGYPSLLVEDDKKKMALESMNKSDYVHTGVSFFLSTFFIGSTSEFQNSVSIMCSYFTDGQGKGTHG